MSLAHLSHGVGAGSFATMLSLVAMWFAMMSVMMAPVAWPWVLAFHRFDLHPPTSGRTASTAAFLGGYGLAWLLYSVFATLIQVVVTPLSSVDGSVGLTRTAAGIVLIAAGLVQFSSFKRACLTHCRNPFSYLLARWRQGPLPAWRIGFGHGVFCVGCCWALMATMLAVGVINIWWMFAITVAAFAEQVTRRGELTRVAIGIALIGAGCARALS